MGVDDRLRQVALERRDGEQAGLRVDEAARVERGDMAAQSHPEGVDAHQRQHVGDDVLGLAADRFEAAQARLPDLPGVPTMIESGFPDFVASSWTSIMAPAGTPRDIVNKLNASINAGLGSPQMQVRFKQLAAEARPGTPEELTAFVASEIPKWQAMAKLAGISGE